MGNRTSGNTLQKKEHYSSYSSNDKSYYDKMEKILNHHFNIIHSNTDANQTVMDMHKTTLITALKHHINATHLYTPRHQEVQQTIYSL